MLNRRTVLATGAIAAVPLSTPLSALAQGRKDAVTLAMTLEPPGLDPTAGAASAIAEIVQYNIFETLTKINPDGSVSPLLAESWEVSPDLKTYTFKLRRGVKFQNGEPFTAAAVKFSYDRAGGEKSTNKDKRTFAGITTQVVDDYTVVLLNKEIDPDLLFVLGQATSIIVEPKSADTNANKPVGTGPYQLQAWNKGSSVVLTAWAAGGLIAIAGAFSYAELGRLLPRAGGQYVYLREAWHPIAGFLYGWALLFMIETGAMAAVAIAFAEYALRLVGVTEMSPRPLAIAAIVLLTAVNYVGVKPGSRVLNVFVILKVAALALLILLAWLHPSAPGCLTATRTDETPSGLLTFGLALIPILLRTADGRTRTTSPKKCATRAGTCR